MEFRPCGTLHRFRRTLLLLRNFLPFLKTAVNFLLWKPDEGRWSVVAQVPAHRRKISCLSWSDLDKGFLATCSPDGQIRVWDVRTPAKPQVVKKVAFAMGAPPSLVKWNRFNSVSLASVHKGQVCLWDMRVCSFHSCRFKFAENASPCGYNFCGHQRIKRARLELRGAKRYTNCHKNHKVQGIFKQLFFQVLFTFCSFGLSINCRNLLRPELHLPTSRKPSSRFVALSFSPKITLTNFSLLAKELCVPRKVSVQFNFLIFLTRKK